MEHRDKMELFLQRFDRVMEDFHKKVGDIVKNSTLKFISTDFLKTNEEIAGYLTASLEEGGVNLFQLALGDVVKKHGVIRLMEDTGLSRSTIYKAISTDTKPGLATVLAILKGMGVSIQIVAAPKPDKGG